MPGHAIDPDPGLWGTKVPSGERLLGEQETGMEQADKGPFLTVIRTLSREYYCHLRASYRKLISLRAVLDVLF